MKLDIMDQLVPTKPKHTCFDLARGLWCRRWSCCLQDQKLLVRSLMCSCLHSDFALGNGKYPKTLEDAIHVLTTHAVAEASMERWLTKVKQRMIMMTLSCHFISNRLSRSVGNVAKWGISRRMNVLSLRRKWNRSCSFFPGLAKRVCVHSSAMLLKITA
jgi:hypothetical protein